MPYPVRIQPIDFNAPEELRRRFDPVPKPVLSKFRFKRLFERQLSRNSLTDKSAGCTEPLSRDGSDEFEPSSVCLARMVLNYMEEPNEKTILKCGRNRCNCFNVNGTDSSDEEHDSSSSDACNVLKSLVPCSSVSERNLLADVAKIVETSKISKRKDGICRKLVADGLITLGYNAAVCKSQWEKSPSFPAGEYEYVDVINGEEIVIIDIDFRSEFEIARSSKAYKQILQTLPNTFVGKADRLESIIDIVSEAAKQSLKKIGMHIPPWRKADYVKAKWLSPSTTRINPISTQVDNQEMLTCKECSCEGEFELLFGEKNDTADNGGGLESNTNSSSSSPSEKCGVEVVGPLVNQWEPPEIKSKSVLKGVKVVTGLASVIEDDDN